MINLENKINKFLITSLTLLSLNLSCAFIQKKPEAYITEKLEINQETQWWNFFGNTFVLPITRHINPEESFLRAIGHPKQAKNLEVEDSSFYTNRDISSISLEEIRFGPVTQKDLPLSPYTILKPKPTGVSKGFFVQDDKGDKYLFKFDSIQYPESSTSAEVITSKILYALGYFVPKNEIVFFNKEDLIIKPEINFTQQDLETILNSLINQNDNIRAVATKLIDGEILGHITYDKHRFRRELRALRIAFAFVNNTDAKDQNVLVSWDEQNKITRFYLIDFGSSLGASAYGIKTPQDGYKNLVDWGEMVSDFFTFGLDKDIYNEEKIFSPAVGNFSPNFNPDKWKPYLPNRAFEDTTIEDAQWMIEKLAYFTDEKIRAAVNAGKYSRKEDEQRVCEVLSKRRDILIEHYLNKENRISKKDLVFLPIEIPLGVIYYPPLFAKYLINRF